MKKSIQFYIINLLNNFGLKKFVKYAYYFLGYQLSKLIKTNVYSDYELNEIGEKNEESFFGYYDKSPESPGGEYVAYHQTKLPTHCAPNAKFSGVDIMILDRKSHNSMKVDNSQAFNWQQGTKLMWINSRELIYNIYKDGEYKSVLYNVITKSRKTYSSSIYDCFKNDYALTLNYERLDAFSPDYGYCSHARKETLPTLDKDGIWKMDLSSGETNLMISLKTLKSLRVQKSMLDAVHWVNHIMISPDGKRFIFFHRWSFQTKRFDRLLCYNFNTESLEILADKGLVSHFFWVNASEVIGFMTDSDGKPKLIRIDIDKADYKEFKYSYNADIHMNVFKSKMLFDTYPDFYRLKTLGIADLDTGESIVLGRFREPLRYYNRNRCDLHSRFSYSGERIYFDSVHSGKRKLYYLEKKL